jgi:hypothetical protein
VNSRNAATGMATPPTAYTASPGWSTPRYCLASATTVTIPRVLSFAYDRGRPATSSVYVMPISRAVRIATGADGMEYPPHPLMIATS